MAMVLKSGSVFEGAFCSASLEKYNRLKIKYVIARPDPFAFRLVFEGQGRAACALTNSGGEPPLPESGEFQSAALIMTLPHLCSGVIPALKSVEGLREIAHLE